MRPEPDACDDEGACSLSTQSSSHCSVVYEAGAAAPVRRCTETRRVMRHCLGRAPEEVETHTRTTEEELKGGGLGSFFGGYSAPPGGEQSDAFARELEQAQREAEELAGAVGPLFEGLFRAFGADLPSLGQPHGQPAAERKDMDSAGTLGRLLGGFLGRGGKGVGAERRAGGSSSGRDHSPYDDLAPGEIKEV